MVINDYRHLVNSSVLGNRLSPTGGTTHRVYQMVVIIGNPHAPSSFWRLPVYQKVITRVSVQFLKITSLPNSDNQQKLKGTLGYHFLVNW